MNDNIEGTNDVANICLFAFLFLVSILIYVQFEIFPSTVAVANQFIEKLENVPTTHANFQNKFPWSSDPKISEENRRQFVKKINIPTPTSSQISQTSQTPIANVTDVQPIVQETAQETTQETTQESQSESVQTSVTTPESESPSSSQFWMWMGISFGIWSFVMTVVVIILIVVTKRTNK